MKQIKNNYLGIIISLLPIIGYSQNGYTIETTDIDNFWKAYDLLESAKTKDDSVRIIQEHYIDVSTKYFKKFVKIRKFTAKEYVHLIRLYPKFWKSIRPLTENIEKRKKEIKDVFNNYKNILPDFKQPNVCFAIGCLRTGGTTKKNLILIGAEIAASNHKVDKSEMTGWLAGVIGGSGDIVSMIAHETVHTQQFNKRRYDLLTGVMTEGVADFFTVELLGLHINKKIFEYGEQHECELKNEFKKDLENYPKEYKRWLYQGNRSKNRPADLGYFIGYKIAKMYYEKSADKQRALQELLNVKKYKSIFKKSEYLKESCGQQRE